MTNPDDRAWLSALVHHSVLVPDARTRRHWQRVIPLLSSAERYELAATLLEIDRRLESTPALTPDPSPEGRGEQAESPLPLREG